MKISIHRSGYQSFGVLLTVFVVVCHEQSAVAQGHTPDPYNIVGEYNNQYEPYMFATEPTEEGTLPNQNRLSERSANLRSNRFGEFQDEPDGIFDSRTAATEKSLEGRSRVGARVPYFKASRDFERAPSANRENDEKYFADQRKRSENYFKAMSVQDPKKRARLLRELNLENLRVTRSLPNFRDSGAAKKTGQFAPETESSRFDLLYDESKPGIHSNPTDDARTKAAQTNVKDPVNSSTVSTPRRPQSKTDDRRNKLRSKYDSFQTDSPSTKASATDEADEALERSERMDRTRRSFSGSPNSSSKP